MSATFMTPALFTEHQILTNKIRQIKYFVIVYVGLQVPNLEKTPWSLTSENPHPPWKLKQVLFLAHTSFVSLNINASKDKLLQDLARVSQIKTFTMWYRAYQTLVNQKNENVVSPSAHIILQFPSYNKHSLRIVLSPLVSVTQSPFRMAVLF